MEIRLRAGESKPVEGASVSVTFASVDADSRCPKGETCVWEGSATVRLTVTGAAGRGDLVLHTSRRAGPAVASYEGWTIGLIALEPYPVSGQQIAQGDYVVTLQVVQDAATVAD